MIPEGARNIRVEEVAEANNFLALQNSKGWLSCVLIII